MNEFIEFFSKFNVQTLLAMIAILWYFTRDIRNEIKKEIDAIRQEIDAIRQESVNQARRTDEQSKRSDRLYESFQSGLTSMREEIAEQSKRSDRLYEMFIDLLKEKKLP